MSSPMQKYSRERLLGKGGFGAAILVHLKADPSVKYVMKEVSLAQMSRKEQKEAEREVDFLKRLHHPNIIKFIESFKEKGGLYIVMDYADGGDLHDKVKSLRKSGKHLTEEEVLSFFVQIALAMQHIHSKRILHRDLKSQNVFLTKKGIVKLGDFGIAKALNSTRDFARTQIGTPYYLSPEICQDKPYNRKSDIWSLGCLLFELMSLKVPFDAPDLKRLVQRILVAPPPKLPSRYSRELCSLVGDMLQKDPRKRPNINQVLRLPVIREAMKKFHSTITQREFGAALATSGDAKAATPVEKPEKPRVQLKNGVFDAPAASVRPTVHQGPAKDDPAMIEMAKRRLAEEARLRKRARAVQMERDKQRLLAAQKALAERGTPTDRERKEKEAQKREREKWLEREREKEKRLEEIAMKKREVLERARAAAREEREREEKRRRELLAEAQRKEAEERRAAALRNREQVEAPPPRAANFGDFGGYAAPEGLPPRRQRDSGSDRLAAERARIWMENQRAKERNRAAVEGQLGRPDIVRSASAPNVEDERYGGASYQRAMERKLLNQERRRMEQKLHEERAAAAARAAYFENMAARERIKARVNQQLGRPAGGQHYYGGAEAEPMLQQEFSESWKRGEMLEQNQAAKHAAREAEQNAYEKALAEARAQAYRERLELQQKRLQAQQDASQEVPEEGSPGGIAEQMSPRRDLLKSRSADDARPTTADKAAEHAEALAKARREAFEERKRLEELRRRAQEAAEEGSSPATVGTPRSTQSEPAKDAVMNKPPRARRESKKRAGGIRERLEARAKQGKLPPKSALPPREDRRVRRPSGKQQGSAAARPRSVSDQVPEEAEAGVEGLRMPRQRSESENDLHAGRPRKASASEEAAPQGPGINTRLAEALGQVNAVMSEVNDLQFRRKNPSPSPAPEDGGFEDDEEEEDPDAAFREAPEDVPAKGGEQLGDEARQLSDLTSTLLAGVRNDLEDWWNEEEGEEGDLENEMEEEKDAVLHEVDIEFMKDNIMKLLESPPGEDDDDDDDDEGQEEGGMYGADDDEEDEPTEEEGETGEEESGGKGNDGEGSTALERRKNGGSSDATSGGGGGGGGGGKKSSPTSGNHDKKKRKPKQEPVAEDDVEETTNEFSQLWSYLEEYLGAADTSLAYECLRDAVKQGKSEERQRFMLNDLLGVKKATYFAPILQKLMALRFGKQVSY